MKNKKNKEHLIAKREALKTETLHVQFAESNWNPEFRLIDGAFSGLTEDKGWMEGLEWMWKPSSIESDEL